MSEATDHGDERLIQMANQIATFFRGQRSARGPAAETADHLKAFWTPDMRNTFRALAETEAGARLSEVARDAARLLS